MAVRTDQVTLFALTGEGLVRYRASKGSGQVELSASGLDDQFVRRVVADPHHPDRLIATCRENVCASDDGGDTWRPLAAAGLDRRHLWAVAADPHVPDRLYAGTQPAALYVSEDGGASFRESAALRDLENYPYWTFPPPPHEPHVRYVAVDARTPGEIVLGVEEGGVIRSRDYGATWEDVAGPPSRQPRRRPGDGPYIFEDREAGRVHRDVHMVIRHPTDLDTLYAATGMGLYRTTNGGQTWDWLGAAMAHFYAWFVTLHPARPERLYQATANARPRNWKRPRPSRSGDVGVQVGSLAAEETGAQSSVYCSDDGGATWRPLGKGLPSNDPYMVAGLAIDPRDPDYLVVGYQDGRLFASDDAGDRWQPLDVQLDRSPLVGLALT
jgi:photosystem II stability/assembly factor-like uncharacterized protein